MGAYGLACGWQAPIVRAWLGLCSRMISKKWYLFLPADYFVFVVGMICLMLFPDWISSRSLIMSWLAAMALAICSLLRIRNVPTRLLAQSTVIYLMMMPALWGFGNLHPLSIVFNIVLAPLVSFVLLPLALISSVITSWVPAFDKICDIFFWISTQGTEPIELVKTKPLDISTLWIFIFTSHICIHFLRVYLLRNKEI